MGVRDRSRRVRGDRRRDAEPASKRGTARRGRGLNARLGGRHADRARAGGSPAAELGDERGGHDRRERLGEREREPGEPERARSAPTARRGPRSRPSCAGPRGRRGRPTRASRSVIARRASVASGAGTASATSSASAARSGGGNGLPQDLAGHGRGSDSGPRRSAPRGVDARDPAQRASPNHSSAAHAPSRRGAPASRRARTRRRRRRRARAGRGARRSHARTRRAVRRGHEVERQLVACEAQRATEHAGGELGLGRGRAKRAAQRAV